MAILEIKEKRMLWNVNFRKWIKNTELLFQVMWSEAVQKSAVSWFVVQNILSVCSVAFTLNVSIRYRGNEIEQPGDNNWNFRSTFWPGVKDYTESRRMNCCAGCGQTREWLTGAAGGKMDLLPLAASLLCLSHEGLGWFWLESTFYFLFLLFLFFLT